MVPILLIAIGFFLMFPSHIDLGKNKELRRPRTIIFGVSLMVIWFIASYVGGVLYAANEASMNQTIVYVVALVATVALLVGLRQNQEGTQVGAASREISGKLISVATWLLVTAIGLGVLYLAFNYMVGMKEAKERAERYENFKALQSY